MTDDRARELGIFTAWGQFSCMVCSTYTKIAQLSEHNGAIICQKCVQKANSVQTERGQARLFEDQSTLF